MGQPKEKTSEQLVLIEDIETFLRNAIGLAESVHDEGALEKDTLDKLNAAYDAVLSELPDEEEEG